MSPPPSSLPYRLVCFDMQGTLTRSNFGEHFWERLLPAEYARCQGIEPEPARAELREEFSRIGKSDFRYYQADYWLKRWGSPHTVLSLLEGSEVQPSLQPGVEEMLEEIGLFYPLLLFSATTHQFIRLELGAHQQRFIACLSSLEDLGLPGKPARAFQRLAELLDEPAERLIHLGDDPLSDLANPQEAGWEAQLWQGDPQAVLERLRLR